MPDQAPMIRVGAENTYQFSRYVTDECPPEDAKSVRKVIYRAVFGKIITRETFLSHKERSLDCKGENDCLCAGLSVWVELEDLQYAREYHPFAKRKTIAQGEIDFMDGLIMHTPREGNERHHTFWPDIRIDFVSKFKIIMRPVL